MLRGNSAGNINRNRIGYVIIHGTIVVIWCITTRSYGISSEKEYTFAII